MITIAFANEKGGVGKSMSTLCVGYALLQRGYTVLWVDADQQGSLTQSFRYAPPPYLTLGPLLLGHAQPDDECDREAVKARHPDTIRMWSDRAAEYRGKAQQYLSPAPSEAESPA